MFGDAPPTIITVGAELLGDPQAVRSTAEAARRQLGATATCFVVDGACLLQDGLAALGVALPIGATGSGRASLVEGTIADAFELADAMDADSVHVWVGDHVDIGVLSESSASHGIPVVVSVPWAAGPPPLPTRLRDQGFNPTTG